MHDDGICSKLTTKPRLHKLIHIIWTCNIVCTWVFFTILLFWDLDHAKIYKFDLQIRGLVLKLASQTSSRIRAIWSFHLVVSRERLRNIPKRDTHARSVQSICCRLSNLLFCGVPVAVVLTYASRHSQNLNLELRLSLFLL